MNTTTQPSVLHRFSHAPFILRAYIVFAIIATVLSATPLFAPRLNAAMVPYTGWGGFMSYPFTIFFAITACVTSERKSINAVVSLLFLGAVIGVIDTLLHTIGVFSGRDSDNPYLAYESVRPLITIVLPAFWGMLLLLPSVKRWINNAS